MTGIARAALVAVVAAAVAAGCGGGEDDASPEVAWADGVCTSVTTWRDSVSSTAASLQEGGISKERIDGALADVRSATDTLASDLRGLEAPEGEAGAAAEQSLQALIDQLSSGVDTIESAARSASGGEALAAISTIGATASQMQDEVSSTLDELEQRRGALADAFDEADSCEDLRRERS